VFSKHESFGEYWWVSHWSQQWVILGLHCVLGLFLYSEILYFREKLNSVKMERPSTTSSQRIRSNLKMGSPSGLNRHNSTDGLSYPPSTSNHEVDSIHWIGQIKNRSRVRMDRPLTVVCVRRDLINIKFNQIFVVKILNYKFLIEIKKTYSQFNYLNSINWIRQNNITKYLTLQKINGNLVSRTAKTIRYFFVRFLIRRWFWFWYNEK